MMGPRKEAMMVRMREVAWESKLGQQNCPQNHPQNCRLPSVAWIATTFLMRNMAWCMSLNGPRQPRWMNDEHEAWQQQPLQLKTLAIKSRRIYSCTLKCGDWTFLVPRILQTYPMMKERGAN